MSCCARTMQIGVGDNKILCIWERERGWAGGRALRQEKGVKAEMENLNAKVENGYV